MFRKNTNVIEQSSDKELILINVSNDTESVAILNESSALLWNMLPFDFDNVDSIATQILNEYYFDTDYTVQRIKQSIIEVFNKLLDSGYICNC